MLRVHVNIPNMTHTESGKRKVWSTNGKHHPMLLKRKDELNGWVTYACSLDPVIFIWEKSTKHNDYNGYSCYVSPKHVEVL